MSPALAALAVLVVAGGVVAVSARDARTSIVGLAIALMFAPLVAEPFPDRLVLAARFVGAVLTVYLLWVVARDGFDIRQPRLRWPVETLIAVAAGLAGLSSAALTSPPVSEVAAVGLPVARGASFAIGALAIIPILEGRDALRLGTGLTLAILSVALLQQGMGVTLAPVAQLAFAGVMIGVAGTSAGIGSLALAVADRAERPLRTGAHPIGHPADSGGERPPGSRGFDVRALGARALGAQALGAGRVEAAVRDRLAMARVAERLAVIGVRSRRAARTVRSAGLGGRAVTEVRRRVERPRTEEPAAQSATLEPDAATPDVEDGADPAEIPVPSDDDERASGPSMVTARSAGARRWRPRRE
jgi:hypothetical protein